MQNVLLPMLQAFWTVLESYSVFGHIGPFGPFQTILNHFSLSLAIKPSWTIGDHLTISDQIEQF